MSLGDWGFRAVAHSVSDIVAAGGAPRAVWYSVGVSGWEEALEVARGVGEAARLLGVEVLKSDFNRGVEGWIDVASVGVPAAGRPVSRRGGRPGDVLFQVGFLGYGLLERLALEGRIPVERVVGLARRVPPVGAARAVSLYASASQDNSDGWAVTLWGLSRWSGVGIVVEELVAAPEVEVILEEAGLGSEGLLGSWEDLNLAVLVPADRAEAFLEECRASGTPCFRAGRAVQGEGVYYGGRRVRVEGWSWV